MRDKLKLTTELVEQLPAEYKVTPEEARISWFYNIKNDGGLRLTSFGYEILIKVLELEHYVYKIPNPLEFTQKTVLLLDRKLQMPFYISANNKKMPVALIFFSSKEAMLANLYGNLEKFLDNYS